MDSKALKTKGVIPVASEQGYLPGWQLRFDVAHFFRHEGGMANIIETRAPNDTVHGVLHRLDDNALQDLDRLEAYGIGYDRIEVSVHTVSGEQKAFAYVGLPAFIDPTRLPTQRYRNILVRGARAAGLEDAYVDALEGHTLMTPPAHDPFCAPSARTFTHAMITEDMAIVLGHVFDMTHARLAHQIPRGWFSGREVSLFLLRRMDSSDGSECPDDICYDRLNPDQLAYLNTYLHAFADEYVHLGIFDYTSIPTAMYLT